MREGYKQTEIGVIPEDWNVVLLDSVAKRGSGHTPDKKYPEYWNGNIKWISLKDSDRLDALYIYDTADKTTLLGIANSSAVVHSVGTVVLSRDAGVGKSAIMRDEMAVSQHFMAWQCSPQLNNHLLYYWLQAKKPEFERIAIGNTIKTIGLPYFKQLKIPFPPLEEQRLIAQALSDVDTLIAALDKLIAKKRDLKAATMQQLLTGKKRLPGFGEGRGYKESVIGLIPEDWLTLAIGELFDFKNGLNKSKEFFGSGTPIVNYMDIFEHPGLLSKNVLGKVNVTKDEIRAYGLKQGDIFFTRTSETVEEIGYAAVLLEDIQNGVFSGFILRARSKAFDLDLLFKKYCFASNIIRKQITSSSSYTTRALTNGRLLSRVMLPCPAQKEEQHAVATILSDMDAEIAALESRLTKNQAMKQGMMQDLLTGRVRLKIEI